MKKTSIFLIFLLITIIPVTIEAQKTSTADSGFSQKKIIKGTLDSKGNAIIKKADLKENRLDFKNPNFYIIAYVHIKKYWVTSRVFINKEDISLETSESFKKYPYIIIILY
jgi:hypothetical protein